MRNQESFDAFYARSVRSVTSQMRSLAGDAEEADQAVREAYSRAFQQWYEVSGFRDAEGWVLDAAKDAYRRRVGLRGPASANGDSPAVGGSSAQGDSPAVDGSPAPDGSPALGGSTALDGSPGPTGSPGLGVPGFAPGIGASQTPALDPATWAPPTRRDPAAPPDIMGQQMPPYGGYGQGEPFGGWDTPRNGRPAGPTSVLGTDNDATSGGRFPRSTRSAGQPSMTGQRPGRGPLVIAVALIVMAVAVGGYFAFGRHNPSQPGAAGSRHTSKITTKPKAHMLRAGKVGTRTSVPWSLVGPGWTLVQATSAAPDADGNPTGSGKSALYLVDPQGGRYTITSWSGMATSHLFAWSGDKSKALFINPSTGTNSLLSLSSGQITNLSLPPSVAVVGFTRPDGLALLAVRQQSARLKLQRYDLQGNFQATIDTMPQKSAQPTSAWESITCGSGCGALSSPDGDMDVWGTTVNEMRLVANGGGLIRKLPVPGSGASRACAPLSWWNSATVVANCAAPGQPTKDSERLWLVPVDGSAPSPLTPGSGELAGSGFNVTASQVNGSWYVTQTGLTQCPSAASGPGGLGIMQAASGGTLSSVSVPGTKGTRNTVLAGVGDRMLVLGQTSCPGSYSLLWFNPSSGSSQALLPAPSGEIGVVDAIPYGTW